MARDLDIKGTAGIVGSEQYVYRKERDLTKTQVDWGTVSKTLTDTINTIRDDREQQKADLAKTTRERMNKLQELEQYDNQSLNTKIVGLSHEAGNFIQTQNDLMRRGLISPSDFLQSTQQVSDNFKSMKTAFSTFDKDFQNAQLRTQNEESNIMEQYEMMGIAGFGNLANLDYFLNPTTGTVSFVKKQMVDGEYVEMTDEYLSDPANHLSMNTINVRLNNKSNYTNTSEAVAAEVENLGEVVTAEYMLRQGVQTYEDWYQLEDSPKILEGLITTVLNNDAQKASCLQDMDYNADDFTEDPEVAAKDPRKILMVPAKDGSGRLVPQFNEQQEEELKKFIANKFRGQINSKLSLLKGHQVTYKPSPTATEIGLKRDEKKISNLYGTVNDLVTGDANKANSSANTLVTIYNKNRGENDPMIKTITRKGGVFTIETTDGIRTVESTHKDGTAKTTNDIIKEIYDNVNPYEADVTVAIDAYDGTVGDAVGEGDATGTSAFEKIPEIDYDSPIMIGGVETGAEAYIESKLDPRFDDWNNAEAEEIIATYSAVIDASIPKVLRDNYDITVEASDAESDEEDEGYIKVYANGKLIGTVTRTHHKTTMGAWKEIQGFLNGLRADYNKGAGKGGKELN